MSNKPVKSHKDGWFSASIFEGEYDGRKTYNVSIQKGFKRKDSDEVEYQTISLFPEDLLKLSQLCERAYWSVSDLRDADYQRSKEGNEKPAPKPAASTKKASDDDEIPF